MFAPHYPLWIIKKIFGQFWVKMFFPILAQNCLVQKWPKEILIMQSGHGERTLFYKISSFIIEKMLFVQWFHFRTWRFMIFLSGATETDFFENSRWNYMKIASKWHIPFLWRIFLRLGSPSSCGVYDYCQCASFYHSKVLKRRQRWYFR